MINSNYIEKNLIAYIGNKRRLLDLIKKAILKTNLSASDKNIKFLDLFAGTGVVSRLAKNLGLEVHSNDWEYYSYIMNRAFIELDNNFLEKSFEKLGGIKTVIDILNNLETIDEKDRYISKYYCPEDDKKPNLENERMFWTNYNGRKIDMIRTKIEEWASLSLINENEEIFLISLLLYEASTRSNTSGVFKGFHRGFGGTNGDALTRILKKIELKIPELINGKNSYVYNENAITLSEKLKETFFDIAYLDPPYNQHQYGSNYHLLNTIALNDKPNVNKNVILDGKRINKSAIRRDWIKTKSTFCYKNKASSDFKQIINNINSHYILVSYSTDGIIPFSEMLNILSSKGKLSIEMSEYVKFRGGKQALTSEVNNIEFILIVDTTLKSDISDIEMVNKKLFLEKINLTVKKTVSPVLAEIAGFQYRHKLVNDNMSVQKILEKKYDNILVKYVIEKNKISENISDILNDLSFEALKNVLTDLEFITNLTKEDEIYLSMKEIEKYYLTEQFNDMYETFKKIPYLLSKFNNKKAYNASLRCILDLLNLLNKTVNVWIKFNFLENRSFIKFEKIILTKINHKTKEDYTEIKSSIGKEYEMLLENLQSKPSKNTVKQIENNLSVSNYSFV
ncbi:MAG TPA: DNA adenine methylase [Spirochaetota bacterium]|nr:DNA adenine methylase [Spirochaetota bacterium]